MTQQSEDEQLHESTSMKITATAIGVVVGVSLIAVIMGISSQGYSILTKTALPLLSQQDPVSKSRPGQTRLTQAPPVAPEHSLPSSVPKRPLEQPDNLKQFPGPAVAGESSEQGANLRATRRLKSPGTVAPAVTSGKSHIAMRAIQGSWIDACADGQTVFRRYFPQLSSVDLGFLNDAVVRLGNSGGVEVSVNGTPTGSLGVSAQTRVVQFDAKGFRFLMAGDPGTECGR